MVFPGGVSEPADIADRWLTHLSSFGYSNSDFEALHRAGTTVTPLFQDNPVQRHISLRITAIRETFEELGLLLCSRDHKKDRCSDCASFISDIDLKYWQQRVSDNPAELLSLCKEYKCYPDIWSLYYWSSWLSPVNLPKRFSAAFFVTALATKPEGLKSNAEVIDVKWSNPLEVLQNPHLVLYPPQVYELNRLSSISDIVELTKFAKERSCHGQELLFPISLKAKDGSLHLLPGDELYPSSVDYYNTTVKSVEKTIAELRQSSNIIHRFEVSEPSQFIFKNYKPENHINMGDKTITANVVVH